MSDEKDRFTRIPIERATKPRDGFVVIMERYWIVVDEKILFFDPNRIGGRYMGSPQCNENEQIAARMAKAHHGNAEVRYLAMVYVPNEGY